jgi:hypothetical protein
MYYADSCITALDLLLWISGKSIASKPDITFFLSWWNGMRVVSMDASSTVLNQQPVSFTGGDDVPRYGAAM